MIAKHAHHIGGGFKAALGVWLCATADLINRNACPHAGQNIRQLATTAVVHQHIADRNHRYGSAVRQRCYRIDAGFIAPVISWGGPQKGIARKAARDGLDLLQRPIRTAL